MAEVAIDFSRRFGDGERRRRRHYRARDADWREEVRRRLQKVGFTQHEIRLWIKEEIPLGSRVGNNLIYARRRLMKYWKEKGYNFQEARAKSSLDREQSAINVHPELKEYKSPTSEKRLYEDYLWSTLYVIAPKERKITGPIVREGY